MNEPPMFEVRAFAALRRGEEHGKALEAAMAEASHALAEAGLDDLVRQLEKVIELQRFASVRVTLMAQRVARGRT